MKYKRLTDVLADCWDKPWGSLSGDQRMAWIESLGIAWSGIDGDGQRWDAYDAAVRRRIVEDHDQQHDPACAPENEAWSNHYDAIRQKEREIDEWESMNHQGDPLRAQARQVGLDRLRAELDAIRKAAPSGPADSRSGGASSATEEGADAVRALAEEIKRRNPNFDPNNAPGRIRDFHELAQAWGKHEARQKLTQSESSIDRYRKGIVTFKQGAKESSFYRDTFPELFSK